MRIQRNLFLAAFVTAACISLSFAISGIAQSLEFKKAQVETILDDVAGMVRKQYYDPKLRGLDWDAQIRDAKQKIGSATSRNAAFATVAALLDSLNDSHTFFIPQHSFSIDYGWRMQMIGDRCLVTKVRPQTDAESKIRPGEEVLLVNGYRPSRNNLERIEYLLNVLRPQNKLDVSVRSLEGQERSFEVSPKVFQHGLGDFSMGEFRMASEQTQKAVEPRFVSVSDDVLVAKIPQFFLSEADVGKLISAARKHKAMVVDLRGNPGGQRDAVKLLLGGFFDHEVRFIDVVSRKGTRSLVVKPDRHPFLGKLIVLVDNKSASGSELFARTVQLENRGIVVGDQTAGMLMESEFASGVSAGMVIGVSITVADIRLPDGKSLEHIGVTPDEFVFPAASDLAQGRDPVLAHATEMAGAKISAEKAAKLFPYEWTQPYRSFGN